MFIERIFNRFDGPPKNKVTHGIKTESGVLALNISFGYPWLMAGRLLGPARSIKSVKYQRAAV